MIKLKKVLFIGSLRSIQGRGRYESFKEIMGDDNIDYFDANDFVSKTFNKYLLAAWGKIGGSKLLDKTIKNHLKKYINHKYLLVWIECPEFFGPISLEFFRTISDNIHLYGIDNPFEGQGRKRFSLFLRGIQFYTSMIFFRESSVETARNITSANIKREFQCYPKFLYDYAQRLSSLNSENINFYRPGALFIGTNIPQNNRLGVLKEIAKNIPSLHIYGNKWPNKLKCYPCQFIKTQIINEEYVKAIQTKCANIVLLNKKNLDLCTTRSIEIPAFGGLALYPNTSDHEILLGENLDFLKFKNHYELIKKINLLSIDTSFSKEMRIKLQKRIARLKLSSSDSIKRQLHVLSIKGLEKN